VQCGVVGVTDAQQQDPRVKFVEAGQRGAFPKRMLKGMAGRDFIGVWAERAKRTLAGGYFAAFPDSGGSIRRSLP
jgi:hypothetical protein